jgi:hypothetical protein
LTRVRADFDVLIDLAGAVAVLLAQRPAPAGCDDTIAGPGLRRSPIARFRRRR